MANTVVRCRPSPLLLIIQPALPEHPAKKLSTMSSPSSQQLSQQPAGKLSTTSSPRASSRKSIHDKLSQQPATLPAASQQIMHDELSKTKSSQPTNYSQRALSEQQRLHKNALQRKRRCQDVALLNKYFDGAAVTEEEEKKAL